VAIVKFVTAGCPLNNIFPYIMNREKTDETLISGIHCMPETAAEEFRFTKRQFHKEDGRTYYHIIQSFSPDDHITPQTAHEIGLRFAEYFPGYQIVVATHRNTDHIHNHIVMNSVNFETGRKFHQTAEELQAVKEYSNRLCGEYGLSQTEVKSGFNRMPKWKRELRDLVYRVACCTRSKEEFIEKMQAKGYEVKWIDEQKYITFKTPDGHLCRDNKLFAEQLLRKNLEIYFLLGGCDSPLAEQYQQYVNHAFPEDSYTVEDGLFQLFRGLLETVPEEMQTDPPIPPDELDKETVMALEALGIKVEPKALVCYSTQEQYEQQMGLYL